MSICKVLANVNCNCGFHLLKYYIVFGDVNILPSYFLHSLHKYFNKIQIKPSYFIGFSFDMTSLKNNKKKKNSCYITCIIVNITIP